MSREGGKGPPSSSSVSRAQLLNIQFSGPSLCFDGHSCKETVQDKNMLLELLY